MYSLQLLWDEFFTDGWCINHPIPSSCNPLAWIQRQNWVLGTDPNACLQIGFMTYAEQDSQAVKLYAAFYIMFLIFLAFSS